jgi:hypothetical protein
VCLRITMSSPAYRATLLLIRWAQVETVLTFLHFRCTSCYITCRRFECFYGESMGKYGQFYGQMLSKFLCLSCRRSSSRASHADVEPKGGGFRFEP